MADANTNHKTEEQLALDQTLNSQELNLVDQQVLAANTFVEDDVSNVKVPESPVDEKLSLNTQQFNLSDDSFNNALAKMNLGVEETNETSNLVPSVEEQPSTSVSAASEETASKNNTIEVELKTDIPSCSKSEPQPNDLSACFENLSIQTSDETPTTVLSDQELAEFSNDKAWKNLYETEFKTNGTETYERETCRVLEDVVFHTPEWEHIRKSINMGIEKSLKTAPQNNQRNVLGTDIPGPSLPTESEPSAVESPNNKQSVKTEKKVKPKEPARTIEIPAGDLARFSNHKEWKNLSNILAGTFDIFAFTVKLVGEIPKIGVLAQNTRISGKSVYNLRGAYEERFKYYFDNFELKLEKEGYHRTPYKRLNIIYRTGLLPIAKFTINGTENYKGKICPRYEDFEFHTSSWYNYEKHFGMSKEDLSNSFLWDNWVDQDFDRFSEYSIYAFTLDRVRYPRNPAVGVLASQKNSDSKRVYKFKGLRKPEFIQRYDNRGPLINELYGVVNCNNSDVMFLKSEKPVAELKTGGITTWKGNSFPKVIDLNFYDDNLLPKTDRKTELIFGETKEKLSSLFDSENQKRLDKTGKYKVYAFTVVGTKSSSRVFALAKKGSAKSKKVFCIEGRASEKFKDLFSTKEQRLPQCKMMKLNSNEIMYLTTEQPIATFETNGMAFETNCLIPKIENLDFSKLILRFG